MRIRPKKHTSKTAAKLTLTSLKEAPARREQNPGSEVDRNLSFIDWLLLVLVSIILILAPLGMGNSLKGVFSSDSDLQKVLIGPAILLLTAAAFMLTVWREWKLPYPSASAPGMIIAFVSLGIWAAVSIVNTHSRFLSFNGLAILFAALLLGKVISSIGRDGNRMIMLCLVLVIAGTIVGSVGIWEYLEFANQKHFDHRTFSTFVNPDFLAGYLLITIPITLSLFVSLKSKRIQIPIGLCLGLQTACLFLTGSRSGVGILCVSLLLWLLASWFSHSVKGLWKQVSFGFAILGLTAILSSFPTLGRVISGKPDGGNQTQTLPATISSGASAQSHSAEFRKWTWKATIAMTMANPITGTGIGSFDIAYPRYAETAYTGHAHNGYLQLSGETGFPGIICLLIALASASAFSVFTLFKKRLAPSDTPADISYDIRVIPLLRILEPRLLLAGLIISMIASMLHNIIDSDWFVPAITLTFAATLSLMIVTASSLEPQTALKQAKMEREIVVLGLIASLFMIWRGRQIAISRLAIPRAAEIMSITASNLPAILDECHSAAEADPFDPEPHLLLSQILNWQQKPMDAISELQKAVRIAPTSENYYRLGRHFAEQKDWQHAISAYEQSRSLAPHNLQTLRHLAETLKSAGQLQDAKLVYQNMTELELKPYGMVRAIPEVPETDFAFAHAGLADLSFDAQDWKEAEREYRLAEKELQEYWRDRNTEMNLASRTYARRKELPELYRHVLQNLEGSLSHQSRSEEARAVVQQLQKLEVDVQSDKSSEVSANGMQLP